MNFIKKLIKKILKKYNPIADIIDKYVKTTNNDDLIIDVGANVGDFSKLFLKNNCQIYAFEPNPDAFAKLKSLESKMFNLRAINAATCTFNGEVDLYNHKEFEDNPIQLSVASSIYQNKENVDAKNIFRAKAIDLAQFIIELKRPVRLLKIDIEGYEVELIPHLQKTGALDYVNYMIVETHEQKNNFLLSKTLSMKNLLKESGFNRVNWDYY